MLLRRMPDPVPHASGTVDIHLRGKAGEIHAVVLQKRCVGWD